MKPITVFAFILLTFHFAYGQTNKETQKIVEEILTITEKYNQTWETLNMEKVAKFHSDSSFRYYRNMKLSVGNNEEFKKTYSQIMKGAKSWTIKVINPVVQVLSGKAAVISFTAKAEAISNDNEISDNGTGAYTYVWKKTNDQWKIIHIHESTK